MLGAVAGNDASDGIAEHSPELTATHVQEHAMIAQHSPSTVQQPSRAEWLRRGIGAATLSAAAVVISQLTALAIWPDLSAFEPLNLPPRSALFAALPALAATWVLAWLDRRVQRPVRTFLLISVSVLIVSIPPDYLLPIAGKTLLASSVTAALHVVAAAVTVAVLLLGYRTLRADA